MQTKSFVVSVAGVLLTVAAGLLVVTSVRREQAPRVVANPNQPPPPTSDTNVTADCVQEPVSGWEDPRERPFENGRWLCWSYNGKGDWARVITRAETLPYYIRQAPSFDPELQWTADHADDSWRVSGKIQTVGALAGMAVVDIFFTAGQEQKPFAKMVLLGQRASFRPVIWILDQTGVELTGSVIVEVGKRHVLVSRCRIPGTGNYYLEDYLVFDEQGQIPMNLRADAVIREALDRALPEGSGVWKGGRFDIASLTFISEVWKEGDANCCGTGGRIELRLELHDHQLTVSHVNFDPLFQGD